MEYRYAEEVGVPTIAFLIDECVDLPKAKLKMIPRKTRNYKNFGNILKQQDFANLILLRRI